LPEEKHLNNDDDPGGRGSSVESLES